MIGALVLAAGESSRMGRLKPLIKIDGLTFLQRIVNELRAAGIDNINIVVGFAADRIQKESGVDVDFVENINYKFGQFSSLQCGIQSLSEQCTGVVVCLADQPQVKSDWINRLVQHFEKTKAAIIRPSFRGKSGHPIIYSAHVFQTILDLPPTATAKELMTTFADDTVFVEMDSDGILYDADRPEDVQTIRQFLG
jgi:CTP:molybdopterin cytidylyltransferase MocA